MVKSPIISEAKIRQAIWMLKKGKTKKAVCKHIGISYSPKRLDTIIEDFHKRLERDKELKAKARFKKFSESEKKNMADAIAKLKINHNNSEHKKYSNALTPSRPINAIVMMV